METDSRTETMDGSDFTNSIDFSLAIGLGYKLENGLNYAAQYNLGLSNILDGKESDDISRQNGVSQISVGYFFN